MRRLTLRREVLAELTAADLTSVVAAAPDLTLLDCVDVAQPSGELRVCNSLLRPCAMTYTCTR